MGALEEFKQDYGSDKLDPAQKKMARNALNDDRKAFLTGVGSTIAGYISVKHAVEGDPPLLTGAVSLGLGIASGVFRHAARIARGRVDYTAGYQDALCGESPKVVLNQGHFAIDIPLIYAEPVLTGPLRPAPAAAGTPEHLSA